MTIRTKLSFWFVLAALLPAVVITAFAAGEAGRRFRARAIEELTQAGENGVEELDSLRRSLINRLRDALEEPQVREFLQNVSETNEPVEDAWSFAGEINDDLGLGFDYLDFLRDDGIVISSLEWQEYVSYRYPHWDDISALPGGGTVVGPVRVVERDHLALRALLRPEGFVVIGGLALDERVLRRFRTAARADVFLLDRVAGGVVSGRLTDQERRLTAELWKRFGTDGPLPAETSQLALAGGQYFLRAVPLGPDGGASMGAILFLYPRKELDETIAGLLTTFLLAAAIGVGLALVLGFLISRGVANPLRKLIYGFDLVALGDFSARLHGRRRDELGELFTAFNRMAADLGKLQQQLARAERVAAWEDVARKVAHEIKNPLSPIRISIETLQKVHERRHPGFDKIFRESTETILEEVEKIRCIVEEFSDFARMPEPEFRPTDLREVVEKAVRLCRPKMDRVEIDVQVGDIPHVNADGERIHRMLMNLILNAFEAMGGGGTLTLRLEPVSGERGVRWVRLLVADDGPGMSEEVKREIFMPYFTTKPGGSGLGLAIVQRIVEQHRGRLRVESSPGRGTEVEVLLPTMNPPAGAGG